MVRGRRGSGRGFVGVMATVLLLPMLSACAPVVGGGVLAAVVAVGALTSHCYDYIDVSVYDPQGRKTCAATVTATNQGDEFELKSCYYAPLTDGHWLIRARLPGFPDAVSAADVDHEHDCTRHVQTMQLTIEAAGVAPPKAFLGAPAAPALPPPPAPPPGAAPPASSSTSTAPAAPAPSTGTPTPANSAAPANTAAPANSQAPAPAPPPASSSAPPSTGVFPDQNSHTSPPK